MLLEQKDFNFVHQAESIEGWLLPQAAYLTAHLMKNQPVQGAVLETGVYKGKYLALLYYFSQGTHKPVIGIDNFEVSDEKDVITNLLAHVGQVDRLKLLREDCLKLEPEQMYEMSGNSPFQFIHIDASHQFPGVMHDLRLAEACLDEQGILVVDDFHSPSWLEVSAAVYRFFFENPNVDLAPFAVCGYKLFLSRKGSHRRCLAEASRYGKLYDMPCLTTFKNNLQQGSFFVNSKLFGHTVITIP